MKKKSGILFLIVSLFLFSINFISARPWGGFSLQEGFYQLEPYFEWILGPVGGGEILFIKFLIFLLVLAVTVTALRRVPTFSENEGTVKILAIIISLMAARYLTTESLINFIWLPYGALGILLSSLLPLIIFFFFIESFDSSFLRKVGWISFIVIYLGLAYFRYEDFIVGSEWWQNLAMIYLAIAVISILALLFDKSIYKIILLSALRRQQSTQGILRKAELQKDLKKITDALGTTGLSKREIKRLENERKKLELAINRVT